MSDLSNRVLPGLLALGLLLPSAVLAQGMVGDPAAGEAHFAGRCGGCHIIENEAGEVLAGRGSLNLYGVAGRVPGSLPEITYSDLMVAYGETGALWEEASFVNYVADPTTFLKGATGELGASRMPSGRVTEEQVAHDLWSYLASFSLAPGGSAAGDATTTAPADSETASE